MGDRRQVYFEDLDIWYYTHWGGSTLIQSLINAIQHAKSRWGDDSYCFRIVISQLIGEDWNDTTGSGIARHSMDSEYKDPIVNIGKQEVKLGDKVFTFEEFVEKGIKYINWG